MDWSQIHELLKVLGTIFGWVGGVISAIWVFSKTVLKAYFSHQDKIEARNRNFVKSSISGLKEDIGTLNHNVEGLTKGLGENSKTLARVGAKLESLEDLPDNFNRTLIALNDFGTRVEKTFGQQNKKLNEVREKVAWWELERKRRNGK